MKPLHVLFAVALSIVSLGVSQGAGADDYSRTIAMFRASPLAQPYFANAYGYAVFPVVGKGGAGLGGAFGKGQVYRDAKVTGRVSLVHLSLGAQLGGQAFSEIIFFQDKRAYDEFTRGSFELDAKASAVAITASAQAEVGTTGISAGAGAGPESQKQLVAKYVKGLAVFVHIKGGLMYEAAVGGQKFSFEPL